MDEIQIAYHEYRVLVVDQTDSEFESHWGVGNRAGMFVAMEMCLQDRNGLITKHSTEIPSPNTVPPLPLPPTPPLEATALLSCPSLPSQDCHLEAEIDRIKLSSESASESLHLHLNQKKEESTNRLKQRLLERKEKKSSDRTEASFGSNMPTPPPNPLPPTPPPRPTSLRSYTHSLPSFVKKLIHFSPLLCPSLSQYQFLSVNTWQENEDP